MSRCFHWKVGVLAALFVAPVFVRGKAPDEIVLVEAKSVSAEAIRDWKKDHFAAVALVLNESTPESIYRNAAALIGEAKLDLYYWIGDK